MNLSAWISLLSLSFIPLTDAASQPDQEESSRSPMRELIYKLESMELKMSRMYKMVKRLKNKDKSINSKKKKRHGVNSFKYIPVEMEATPFLKELTTSDSFQATTLEDASVPNPTTSSPPTAVIAEKKTAVTDSQENKIVYKRSYINCRNGTLSYNEVMDLGPAVRREVIVFRNNRKCVYLP